MITVAVLGSDRRSEKNLRLGAKVGLAACGIINLDFFRLQYSPFCIHPRSTTLQVLILDYVIALYPLILILVTYVCVKLHDHSIFVVHLWSPFYKCFIKIRKEWNITESLIEVFATFFLLSYVKILNTSLQLLTPQYLYDQQGDILPQLYLKADGTVEYFRQHHLPYALVALVIVLFFNILPMVLLFLYPCRCFQRCLNAFDIRRQALHTFVEAFQGSFQYHPRDYRYFAALYLLIRFINLLLLSFLDGVWYFSAAGIIMFLSAIIVGTVKPHRFSLHTYIDVLMFTCLGAVFCCCTNIDFTHELSTFDVQTLYGLTMGVAITVFSLYGVFLLVKRVLPNRIIQPIHDVCEKLWNRIQGVET